ncbi:MAG: hypothetical protein M3280_04565 [Actinomycetota bacterium]|nr:hypothetical protein [Actinomycetota bacterium]
MRRFLLVLVAGVFAYAAGGGTSFEAEGAVLGLRTTPPGQVLVLNANLFQAANKYGAPSRCPDLTPGHPKYEESRACAPRARKGRFARRVRALALKPIADGAVSDGMGYAPDVITLQEVSAGDTRRIADLLNTFTGGAFDYRVAISRLSFPDAVGRRTNAILYSAATLEKLDAHGVLSVTGGGAPTRGVLFSAFRERRTRFGATGQPIAVANVHFPLEKHFRTPRAADLTKARWVEDIADELERADPPEGLGIGATVIGGDFNSGRCSAAPQPIGDEPADNPAATWAPVRENPGCSARPFWNALHNRGYVDTIYAANSATINQQYRDGDAFRRYRIDHIFARGFGTHLDASFDITCGFVPSAPAWQRNCRWLRSSQRYSDHRLQWALLGLDPSPL